MDVEFADDNGDTITIRSVIGDEFIPDVIPQILDGGYCDMLDIPRGSTVTHACNFIRSVLTEEMSRPATRSKASA